MWLNLVVIIGSRVLLKKRHMATSWTVQNVFSVNMFDDFDRFMKVPDQWAPPETTPYSPGVKFKSDLYLLLFAYCFNFSPDIHCVFGKTVKPSINLLLPTLVSWNY